MSTRAIIKIKGFEHAIYKHCDGYPESPGVLSWLPQIVERFVKERGEDPIYLLAQILRQQAILDYEQETPDEKASPYGAKAFLGWGVVSPKDDLGQEYEYTINPKTGKITVRAK